MASVRHAQQLPLFRTYYPVSPPPPSVYGEDEEDQDQEEDIDEEEVTGVEETKALPEGEDQVEEGAIAQVEEEDDVHEEKVDLGVDEEGGEVAEEEAEPDQPLLSTGAIIGIVVGGSLFIGLLVFLIYFFTARRQAASVNLPKPQAAPLSALMQRPALRQYAA